MHLSGGNSRSLPEPLLDFAEHHGARRVRLVVPQSIHVLNTELPPDAEPEELQTAMAFELAGETGGEFDMLRVAAARGETFRMGATSEMLLAAAFEQPLLEHYRKACRANGLDFDGVGALELAALADHAQHAPHARLLLLRRDAGFYAVPGTESHPLTVGPVGLTAVANAQAWDEERYELGNKWGHPALQTLRPSKSSPTLT